MKKQAFTIEGRLPGLNDYTTACRTSPFVGNEMKRDAQDQVCWAIKAGRMKPIRVPAVVHFHWAEQNAKRDLDNIAFAKKFILDALTETGVLKGDGWKHIAGFTDQFSVCRDRPCVIVTIEYSEEGEK